MILVLLNSIVKLGMPTEDVLYLVIVSASYILGQGYVDAKRQPVKEFPIEDISTSVTHIVKAELEKLAVLKDLPLEQIVDAIKPILMKELYNLSVSLSVPETVKDDVVQLPQAVPYATDSTA